MNAIDLRDRVAIVTGAVGEIGFAIAKRLVESGARVWLWDMSEEGLRTANSALQAHGAVDGVCAVDICDEAQVAAGVELALRKSGRIDILVNNAGISGPHAPLSEYTLAEWRKVVDVNLNGAFICTKAVLAPMTAGNYGRIVNIASIAGKEGSPFLSAYSAAKAGMIAMTKTLGRELGNSAILVNCVTPGPTRSRMTADTPPEQLKLMLSKVPMGRLMEPSEVSAMVAWLCSEDCSFSTGAVHDLSGGRSAY
jgi:NAD(P)-dependent dehydrogenase (short-subunit alcohol dehydrogenase family)